MWVWTRDALSRPLAPLASRLLQRCLRWFTFLCMLHSPVCIFLTPDRELNLGNNNLVGTLPSSISALTAVTYVWCALTVSWASCLWFLSPMHPAPHCARLHTFPPLLMRHFSRVLCCRFMGLNQNSLNGPFPVGITTMTGLQTLEVREVAACVGNSARPASKSQSQREVAIPNSRMDMHDEHTKGMYPRL
jgi:hypothetical protein